MDIVNNRKMMSLYNGKISNKNMLTKRGKYRKKKLCIDSTIISDLHCSTCSLGINLLLAGIFGL